MSGITLVLTPSITRSYIDTSSLTASLAWILRSPGASVPLPGEPLFRGGLSHYGIDV